jgi:hypothetical protein
MKQVDVARLMDLITTLIDSADDTGCSEGVTVVAAHPLNRLKELVADYDLDD